MISVHRITANSKTVRKWYDNKGKEWGEYSCGVTGHNCNKTIKIKTGRRKKPSGKS